MMMAGRGDELPVSALPADGTYPSGTARWEKRNISDSVPDLAAGALHPVRQLRDGLSARVIRVRYYDESWLADGADRFRFRAAWPAAGSRICASRCRSPWRTAPAASSASRCARRKASRRPASAPSTWTAKAPLLERERRNLEFFETLPDKSPGRRCVAGPGRAVPDAALRVLRRLRGLWRNALPATPHAALRRPFARRQCDRLLVDLRRQSADDPLVGQRARVAGPPGPIRSSRTTRNSGSGSGCHSTSIARRRSDC